MFLKLAMHYIVTLYDSGKLQIILFALINCFDFSVAGPAIWNWLPDSLRDPAISRDSFRRSLKMFFLFSAYLCT